MLIFTPLCFHLCWMLTMDLMLFTGSATVIQLKMMEESVDDMYDGCRDSAKNIIDQKFSGEKSGPWAKSNSCENKTLQARRPEDKALTKEHLQAICMYTGPGDYDQINEAVREQKNTYGGLFKFHMLHFYLTTALQILNPKQQCHTSYRRTSDIYEGQVGQVIRFGYFASSSTKYNLINFGSETCFKIETCLGANLKKYSVYPNESEILIPPYETFIIKDIIQQYKAPSGLRDCKVVYVLKHSGFKSNLNCKLVEMFKGSSGVGCVMDNNYWVHIALAFHCISWIRCCI